MDASTSRADGVAAFEGWAEVLSDPLFIVTPAGFIEKANTAAAGLVGLPLVELTGRSLEDVVVDPPDKLKRFLALSARGRQAFPGSLHWRKHGGETVWTRCEGGLLRTGQRPLILIRCQPRDVASSRFVALDGKIEELRREVQERRRAEELLRAHNRVLQDVLKAGSLEVVLDGLCRMVEGYCGPSVCASILLLDRDGCTLRHGAAPSLPREYVSAIDGLRTGPAAGSCGTAAWRRENVIVSDIANDPLWEDYRDLALRHGLAACWSTPILATGGAVLGTFAIYHSHPHSPGERETEIVQAVISTAAISIEQKRSAEELERQAYELSRSNAELERFAFVASHDLQEPLRTIASYTQLLARRYSGRLDADADEFIRYIVSGVRGMSELLHDLLAYTRLIHPGSGEGRVRTPARAAVDAAAANLDAVIRQNGASIVCEDLPHVFADPVQLAQVFQNLLSNAVKYRREEPPQVHIECVAQDNAFVFSVADNGIGIQPEHWNQVFSPFSRLHPRQYPGTGMGLAICAKIVESHGGRIWVSSQVGQGSVFRFTMPRD